jgi:inorganic triphosphatase YgiF
MPQETELKLALHPHDLPRLLAHPLLVAQAPRRERLRNTYFDTAALTLMQQRLAVRERQVGRRTLLTVKTAGHSVGGLSQRGEWEAPTQPGRFDFAALVNDTTLAQQLTALAPQLVPVSHRLHPPQLAAAPRWRAGGGGTGPRLHCHPQRTGRPA